MMHNMKEWLLVEEMNTKEMKSKASKPFEKKNDLQGCSKKVFSSIQWIIGKLNKKKCRKLRQTD